MGDALVPFVYSLNIKRDSEAPAGGRSFSCRSTYRKSGHGCMCSADSKLNFERIELAKTENNVKRGFSTGGFILVSDYVRMEVTFSRRTLTQH